MTSRVPIVSPERARGLGEAMGLPARRAQSEAFRVLANNSGVARVAYRQLIHSRRGLSITLCEKKEPRVAAEAVHLGPTHGGDHIRPFAREAVSYVNSDAR